MKKSVQFSFIYAFVALALLLYSRFNLYIDIHTFSYEQIARIIGALVVYAVTLIFGFLITTKSTLYKSNCALGVLAFIMSLTIAPIIGLAALIPMFTVLFVGNKIHSPAPAKK